MRPTTGHAKIYGTLRDANGHAAVGWPIELYSGTIDQDESIGGQPRSTTTDGKGAYAFTKLPAGTYTIVLEPAQTPRSSPQEQQVTVTDRQSVRVDGKLYPPRPCCMPYGAPPARRRTV